MPLRYTIARMNVAGRLLVMCTVLGSLGAQSLTPATAVAPMEEALRENILGFWYPQSLDRKYGGYTINHGPDGQSKGDAPKMIVTQARMVWLFARAARAGYGDRKQMLAAAEHGYQFLTTKMWDTKDGGFYWEVDVTGEKKTRPKKHMYGESFALYAISEYAQASSRKDVLAFATKVFDLFEKKAHDAKHGGYRETFEEDWTPSPAGEPGYMGVDSSVKLMNTHLHLMEAMTTFYRASRLPLARERLLELMTIESNAVVRKDVGSCSDQYQLDWTPIREGGGARSSYGHDLENIWLLVDAAEAAQVPVSPMMDLFRSNFAYSLKYGWDEKDGGFWDWGPFLQPATARRKTWWVEAEALVSALTMFKLTKDPLYWGIFEKTWDFTNRHQIDWVHGEWWPAVSERLESSGDKANAWKAGYHNGRAMIECIQLLKGLQEQK
ncbi:AGE family epimerase/isomerase [Paludibaculum fermentans]|uniref:AGE family epimerase/isomerase n=1 Tax=Paludibaculum fermentans TaxID=1473598 RepID=UPI003EBB3911